MAQISAIERDPIELRNILANDLVSRRLWESGELAFYHLT
jgi:hypothetical protein